MVEHRRSARVLWWAVLAAVLVGLGLRLWWVVYAAHTPVGLADPARYLHAAQGIAHGKGYISILGQPTAYYPPGYPYFLGAIAWLVRLGVPGGVPLVAGVVQALLGTSVVLSAAVIARRVWSPAAAALAAWLVALEPNLIYLSAALLTETLFLALVMAALAVLCLPRRGRWPSTRRVVAFSVLFALAFLVRPVSLPVLLAVGVAWWLLVRRWRTVLRWLGIAVVALVVFVAPWTIRNAVRMHAFIPLSTNTGDNLCIGHEPHAQGGFSFGTACDVPAAYTLQNLDRAVQIEVAHNRQERELGWHYFAGNLDREPWLLWRRAYLTFRNDHGGLRAVESYCGPTQPDARCVSQAWAMPTDVYTTLAAIGDGYWYVLGISGALGVVVLLAARDRRRRPHRVLVGLSTVASVVTLFAFFGDPRFKVPAVPLLCVAAACLFCTLAGALRRNMSQFGTQEVSNCDNVTVGAGVGAGVREGPRGATGERAGEDLQLAGDGGPATSARQRRA